MTFATCSIRIAVCVAVAAMTGVVSGALAQTETQAPQAAKRPAPGIWPKTVPKAAVAPLATDWSKADIEAAQLRCVQVLKGLDFVAIPAAPMRVGDCGAPAPIELVSIGSSPQVTFSPPVTVTCDLAATMHTWVRSELQPIAKRHLGAEVIRIDTMSSYSCRNAYGRTRSRLSEHGKANAIDIRGFMTAKSDYAEVLADWGPNARDIQAQVAAARASAEKAEQLRAAESAAAAAKAATPAQTQTAASPGAPSQAAILPDMRPSISVGGQGVGLPRGPASDSALGLSNIFTAPNRLGGPKGAESESARQRYTQFLRAAHASACKTFGTTLGPEANEQHRNHFHFDLAERATSNFCE
jgi:hypothetical protein